MHPLSLSVLAFQAVDADDIHAPYELVILFIRKIEIPKIVATC